jgi:hypothetical protein
MVLIHESVGYARTPSVVPKFNKLKVPVFVPANVSVYDTSHTILREQAVCNDGGGVDHVILFALADELDHT